MVSQSSLLLTVPSVKNAHPKLIIVLRQIQIASIICSIPRTLNHVSYMSIASAIAMFIAILLNLIFAGAEDHPAYGATG